MMAEYIEREILLKAVEKMDKLDKEVKPSYEYNKQGYILLIKNAPTADVVEVKHAKWEINSDGYYPYCSHCKTEPKNGVMSKYCPECGAKMNLSELPTD